MKDFEKSWKNYTDALREKFEEDMKDEEFSKRLNDYAEYLTEKNNKIAEGIRESIKNKQNQI